MNILFLINSYRLGGAEKLTYDYARIMSEKRGCNVFLCSIGSVGTKTEIEIFNELSKQGIKCFSLDKVSKKNRLKTIIKLVGLCKQLSIDILQTNGPSPNFYGRFVKLFKQKISTVVCIHSTTGYSPLIEKIQANMTDCYVAVSLEVLSYCRKKLNLKKRTIIVENGVNVNVYKKNKMITTNKFVLLSVGRLNPIKNYEKAIQKVSPFIRNNEQVIWKIYGDYEENIDYYEKICDLLKEEGIFEKVMFMGVESDPSKLYAEGDCFILTSIEEGFGISFIEAMLMGIPVLTTRVGVIEQLEKQGVFYLDVDIVDVASELLKMYTDLDVYKEKLDQNIKIIKENYSIENRVDTFIELYNELLER